jgi:hypothetical protein
MNKVERHEALGTADLQEPPPTRDIPLLSGWKETSPNRTKNYSTHSKNTNGATAIESVETEVEVESSNGKAVAADTEMATAIEMGIAQNLHNERDLG